MSIKEPELVPETGIELYSAAKWDRGTIADGTWLQNNTMKPLYENELILASAVHDVSGAIEDDISTCSSKLQAEVEYLSGAHDDLANELGDVSGAIQHEIDTINAGSDVIDVLGSWSDLQNYKGWTTDRDVIKILDDEHSGHKQTYYRYEDDDLTSGTFDPDPSKWEYVGELDAYYSKQDINEYSAANKSYVEQKFTNTSAWVNQRFVDTSGYIDNRFDSTSAYIDTVSGYLQNELSSTSGALAGSAASLNGSIMYVSGQLVYSADLLDQRIKSKSSITYLPTSATYEEIEEPYLAGNEVILVNRDTIGEHFYTMVDALTSGIAPQFSFLRWPYNTTSKDGVIQSSSYGYRRILKGQDPTVTEVNFATKALVDTKQDLLPEHGYSQYNKYLCVSGTDGKLGWMNVPAPVEYSAGSGLSLQNHVFTNTAPNVKSDWDAAAGSDAEILHKPTIPTVNNGTLTIQRNGSTVKTFTANSSTNVSANIAVPTKTSELTNDSNFATTSDIKNGKLTIQKNGEAVATFTANQNLDVSANITVPTVNDGTLTIRQNGTTVATFKANQSTNVSADITVPTTDTTYDPSSSNPQAGTAVSGALATKQDNLPTTGTPSSTYSINISGKAATSEALNTVYSTATDFDTIVPTDNQFRQYGIDGTYTNGPDATGSDNYWGVLIVSWRDSKPFQIYVATNGEVSTRNATGKSGGVWTWNTWKKLALQNGNYPSMSVGNADTVDNYHISVGSLSTDTRTISFIFS